MHAANGLRQIPYFFNRYVFRRDVEPENLFVRGGDDGERLNQGMQIVYVYHGRWFDLLSV